MSRSSDVRAALAVELRDRLPAETIVQEVAFPNHTREELVAAPRVILMRGDRTLANEQGMSAQDVAIEIGVVGLIKPTEGTGVSKDDYRAQILSESDAIDDLFESIFRLWIPDGPLKECGMADHRFDDFTEPTFDGRKLYESGIHLSLLSVVYIDTADE